MVEKVASNTVPPPQPPNLTKHRCELKLPVSEIYIGERVDKHSQSHDLPPSRRAP